MATITEVIDDSRLTVKSSTGPSFLINYSKFLDEKLLKPGSRVALNQQTFGVVEVLPSEKDANVSGMEIDTKPDVTYDVIGGLDDQLELVRPCLLRQWLTKQMQHSLRLLLLNS